MSEHDSEPGEERRGRFRRLARRILEESEEGGRLRVDAREVVNAVLEGGDKAKTEVVRAVAREVRTYLEELGLKEDIHKLITNYSVEVRASVHLRRLSEEEKGPRAETGDPLSSSNRKETVGP